MIVEFSSNNNFVKCPVIINENQNINSNHLEEIENLELNGK